MTKAQSDRIPEPQIMSRGKTQVNYNIREIIIEDIDDKPRTAYEYDVVIVEGDVTRDKIISAILYAEITTDAQIAILFNKQIGKDVPEHDAFQAKRSNAKNIADKNIADKNIADCR